MGALKVTLLIQQARLNSNNTPPTVTGYQGWSESYYLTADFTSFNIAAVDDFIAKRMALACSQATCIGFRVATVDPTGQSRLFKRAINGGARSGCDNVEQALSWSMQSGDSPNRHILTLRGVPDARVETGTYQRQGSYDNALRAFFAALFVNWKFRGKVLSGAKAKILSIDAAGNVITKEAFVVAPNDGIQVLRTFAAGHRAKGGDFVVDTVTDTQHVKLKAWPFGATTGGTIRVNPNPRYGYFGQTLTDEEIVAPEVRERQTGGPFKRSRGRRSAKYA